MEPSQLLQLLLIFVLLLLHSTDADDPSVDSTNPTSSSVVMNDSADDSYKNPFKSRMVIIFVVLDVVGLIVVVWLFILYYKKAKKFNKEMKNRDSEEEQENEEEIEAGEGEVVAGKAKGKLIFMRNEAYFELDDLLKASAEGLGKGNFGNSYKAMLDEDLIVVVKRFRDLKPLSTEEFGKHLHLIAAHNHPNLLPPLAYYCSREEKLLVYKFADNGNLFDRLHGGRGQNRVPFRWNSRLAVAQAVARALEHLHLNTKTETMVPHGNLKSTNVLYTKNNTIVVSDYGLASIIAPPIAAQRMVSYKSPEYQNLRRVSKKSDVWSYGSLLLELLTGRIPSHTAPEGNGVDICSWVHRAVREEWTAEIFDHEICTRRGSCEGMLSLLQIAIGCCDKSPEKRPDMTEVAKEVANIQAVGAEEDDDFSFDRSSFTSKTCGTREYKCDCGTIFSRRDSFITHRAFCDALAEENTKVNQGLANTMRRNLQIQGQVSELLSSMPLNNNPNSTMGLSEFTHSDSKNHLKTLPHEPMPVPPKPLNMAAAGMFSTTSGSLFGCPITASSPSSSSRLQLSTNSSSPSFENGQQLPPPPASTLMSATALLQKAAQMGATASTKMNNSPTKGFVTSMAPTPFGGILLQKNSSSNDHHLQADPTQFLNQFFYQNDGAESEVMSEMGMFSGLFDQNHGLFKNMEHHEHSNSNNILAAKTTNPGLSSTPRNGKTDTMTVDFLGIGGARPGNFHGQQQQQQEMFEGMNINHPRMQGFSSFEQHIAHGQAAMEKTMWEA